MKHHVILLRETPILEQTYNIAEFNFTDDEALPMPGLADELRKCTYKEILDELLIKRGFVERSSFIIQADENGKEHQVAIGQASLLELQQAGTVIITMFFFNQLGLPKYQSVYDLRIEE